MTDISLDNPRLFYAAIALCVAPLWVVDYLPMVDLPQHLAQVAAMRELVAQNPSFEALFTVNWFTPYVLAYAVLYGLSAIVGIPLAAKLVLTLAIAATPLAVGALLREVGASARLRWLAIPGALGFAFYWGLFSFVCALPLALLFVLCAVRYANRPQISRAAGLGVFGIALFFSHVLALGIAALVGYAFVAGLHWRQPKRLVQLAIPFCVPVPLIAVWMLRTQGSEAHVQSTSVSFGPFVDRFSHLASQATGIDFFWPIASPLLAGAIVLAPWFLGLRMTRNPTRWAMFLATCAVFFGFPHYALGTAFLYQRFGGLVLIFWLMLWSAPSTDQASDRRWRELLVMAVVVVIGCFNVLRFSAFDAENAHFTRVLSAMEPGRRVASVVSQFRSDQFSNPVYLHHALWYQVGAKGVVDFNFAFFFPQLVRYRAEAAPPFGDRFAWDPFAYSWSQFNGDAYDYFLFHGPPNAPARFFRNRLGSVTLVAQSGAWSVYQRISE